MTDLPRRILIVDPSVFLRWGLRFYLEEEKFQIHDASNVQDALRFLEIITPNVLICDIILPLHIGHFDETMRTEGLSFVKQVKRSNPEIGVILLSANPFYFQEVHQLSKKYQGLAYIIKGENPNDELLRVIELVIFGGVWIAPEIVNYRRDFINVPLPDTEKAIIKGIIEHLDELSTREKEITRLVAQNYSNQQIAIYLSISLNTVMTHLHNIYSQIEMGDHLSKSKKRSMLAKAYWQSQNHS